jgi:hypothetical protein
VKFYGPCLYSIKLTEEMSFENIRLVLVDVFVDDHFEHGLVAKSALRSLFLQLRNERVV